MLPLVALVCDRHPRVLASAGNRPTAVDESCWGWMRRGSGSGPGSARVSRIDSPVHVADTVRRGGWESGSCLSSLFDPIDRLRRRLSLAARDHRDDQGAHPGSSRWPCSPSRPWSRTRSGATCLWRSRPARSLALGPVTPTVSTASRPSRSQLRRRARRSDGPARRRRCRGHGAPGAVRLTGLQHARR